MERKAVKDLLHIQAWLTRVDEIVRRGKRTPTSPTTCSKRRGTHS